MAVKKLKLMFNKKNRELIGGFPADEVPPMSFQNVVFRTEEYDPEEYCWAGTFDNGKLVKIEQDDNTLIDEDLLNYNVQENINSEYPMHKQINIIMDMLNKNPNIENTKEFTDMVNFIEDERKRNKARKEVYKADGTPYTFISKEDEMNDLKKLLDED